MDSYEFAKAILKATDFNGKLPRRFAEELFADHPELHAKSDIAAACQAAVEHDLTTKDDIDRAAKELDWAYSPMEDSNDWW